jgi:hypothetical protein
LVLWVPYPVQIYSLYRSLVAENLLELGVLSRPLFKVPTALDESTASLGVTLEVATVHQPRLRYGSVTEGIGKSDIGSDEG